MQNGISACKLLLLSEIASEQPSVEFLVGNKRRRCEGRTSEKKQGPIFGGDVWSTDEGRLDRPR